MSRLLPADPRAYQGRAWPRGLALGYLVVLTGRSLVHLLAPDGGARSIATIDTSVVGGGNIIAIFGQWGALQLLLAAVLSLLLLRYRGLTPFVLLILIVEPFLRALAGHLKPVNALGTAPGQALNWLVVPLLAVALFASLRPGPTDQ